MTDPILELKDVHKHFGGVKAVDGVSISIACGVIHAIVGENGAGKSTLMNIIAGVYPRDSGQMRVAGSIYSPKTPRDAHASGISIVFQDLALFPAMPVEANVFAGKEATRGVGLDHAAMRAQTSAALRQMSVELNPARQLGTLTIGEQQWVEIARAVTDESRVLILDEPNSALNQHESEALFGLIRRLKSQGMTVLFISHRLEEVFQIADRITVMRDGCNVGTWEATETTISDIVSAMVGRQPDTGGRRDQRKPSMPVLQVRDLSIEERISAVSFTVRSGEVVGVAGLAGAGVSDLFEALFGVQQATGGDILLDDLACRISSPSDAIRRQVAHVPADRRGLGLMANWSVADNTTLGVLRRFSILGVLQHHRLKDIAQQYVDQLGVVTDSLEKKVLYLSGGNQQKVLLARWLATQPRVLILDDPTRGIDVGAKKEIYELINRIARDGVGVLFTSSELEEILELSDRILVLRKGSLVADLPSAVCDKELVMEFVAGDQEKARELVASRFGLAAKAAISQPVEKLAPELHPGSVVMSPAQGSVAYRQREQTPASPKTDRRESSIPFVSRTFMTLRRIWTMREVGVFQALAIVSLLFAAITPHFLTTSNVSLVLRQMSILGLITMGMTFVLASGEIDLSVGWIFNAVMSVIAFISVRYHLDPWVVLPVGLLVGTFLGAVNGVLAVAIRLPTIIITLGTMTLFRGFALALNQGRTIAGLPKSSFFLLGSGTIGPVSNMTIVMLVAVVICAWIWRNSVFARRVLEMGGNRVAAERLGVRVNRLRVSVMAFSGLMCGLAGVLGLAFLGAADPQSGTGYELSVIAAAIIGGAQLGGGAGTIWGSLIGIGLITVIQNGLVLMGLRPAWQIATTGLVIIAAVTVDYLTRARRARASAVVMS